MKKILFILSFASCSIIPIGAQSQFQRTIGGTNHDQAYSIIQTTDGGYAAAGYTYSFAAGYEDMYIVKFNSSGSLQWTRTVGGTGEEIALSIIQTTDGGYAVAGYTNSFGAGNFDFYIVKLNSSGTLQWSRTIDRANYDYAFSIIQTTGGGFVIAGFSAPGGVFTDDMYIVKLDASGTYQWSKTYGGSGDDIANSIIQTTDGGFAAAGYSDSYGPHNVFYIIKLDSSGVLQWSRLIGETGTGSDVNSVIQTTDGGFALAGGFQPTGTGNYDMYIVKLSSSGSLQWTRTLGGTGDDKAQSIIQTTDGGFVVAGYTNSFGAGNYDMYIAKLNSSGTLQWSRAVGGTGDDQAQSIIKTTDGGFTVAGYTTSFGTGAKDFYIVKFDANGNTCGGTSTPSTISGTSGTLGTPTTTVSNQSPTVSSPTPTVGTGGTLTTLCFVGIKPNSNEIPTPYMLYQNYPNPFNPTTKIKFDIPNINPPLIQGGQGGLVSLIIYDVLGNEVATLVNEKLQPGTYEVEWNAINYPSGVYFYRLTILDPETSSGLYFNETKKLILLK